MQRREILIGRGGLVGGGGGSGVALFVAPSVFSRVAFFLTAQVTETEAAGPEKSGGGGKQWLEFGP